MGSCSDSIWRAVRRGGEREGRRRKRRRRERRVRRRKKNGLRRGSWMNKAQGRRILHPSFKGSTISREEVLESRCWTCSYFWSTYLLQHVPVIVTQFPNWRWSLWRYLSPFFDHFFCFDLILAQKLHLAFPPPPPLLLPPPPPSHEQDINCPVLLWLIWARVATRRDIWVMNMAVSQQRTHLAQNHREKKTNTEINFWVMACTY